MSKRRNSLYRTGRSPDWIKIKNPDAPLRRAFWNSGAANHCPLSIRIVPFCVSSETDWAKAGVTGATAQIILVKSLIERDHLTIRLALTEQGQGQRPPPITTGIRSISGFIALPFTMISAMIV